jgi:hypothetical protein
MESLHKRLDPQKSAALATCEALGQFRTMELFNLKDYPSFKRWLKETTGDENFGLQNQVSLHDGETLGDKLVAAFLRTVSRLEADNARRQQRIDHLEYQLGIRGHKEQTQVISLLQACKA